MKRKTEKHMAAINWPHKRDIIFPKLVNKLQKIVETYFVNPHEFQGPRTSANYRCILILASSVVSV